MECRVDAFRGSGPGGQKRNKTSSGVRITHLPTGLSATATELRSQAQNHRRALERLRRRLAAQHRAPVDLEHFELPEALQGSGWLRRCPDNEAFADAAAVVLDVLEGCHGSLSDTGRLVRASVGTLVRFLAADREVWSKVAEIRRGCGLKPLNNPCRS